MEEEQAPPDYGHTNNGIRKIPAEVSAKVAYNKSKSCIKFEKFEANISTSESTSNSTSTTKSLGGLCKKPEIHPDELIAADRLKQVIEGQEKKIRLLEGEIKKWMEQYKTIHTENEHLKKSNKIFLEENLCLESMLKDGKILAEFVWSLLEPENASTAEDDEAV